MTILKLRETDLHWREIDGELVALDGQDSRYVAANGSGTLLWRALIAGTTPEALAEQLVRTYGIDRERATTDVDRFLAALAERGLLTSSAAR
jgi:Coenzyme PQQ synthesis protein D (PqqD)